MHTMPYEVNISSATDQRHLYLWHGGERDSRRESWSNVYAVNVITQKYIFLHASTLHSECDELKAVINFEK